MRSITVLCAIALFAIPAPSRAATVLSDDFNGEPLGTFYSGGTANIGYPPFPPSIGTASVADCYNGSQCLSFSRALRTKAAFSFNAGDTITVTADVGGTTEFSRPQDPGTIYVGFAFDRYVDLTNVIFNGQNLSDGGGGGSPNYDGGGYSAGANLIFSQFSSLNFSFIPSTAGAFKFGFSSADGRTIYLDNLKISVTPSVPEPATWAMMLIGFGAMGVSLRRRRRTYNLLQAA